MWGLTWLSNGTFFSFLEKRKEAKETQALFRGRGSFSGYLENSWRSWISQITRLQICAEPNLAGVPDALIFFCLLFFYQEKKRPSSEGREVFPGISRIAEGPESLKLLTSKYVPSQTWLSNGAFFSFLDRRKEAKETQALCRRRGSFSGYLENSWRSWISQIIGLQICVVSNGSR